MTETDELRRIANDMRQACIAMCVRQINRRLTRIYDAALREYGVNTAQFNVLVALAIAGADGVQQGKIARALDIEKSTMSRNLARMIKLGWVDADASEGRLRLSAQGRRVVKKALEGWRAAQEQAASELHGSLVEALTRASRASGPRRVS